MDLAAFTAVAGYDNRWIDTHGALWIGRPGQSLESLIAEAEAVGEDEGAPAAPASVTPYQMRQALAAAGLREAVEAAVGRAPSEVRDAWEYALAVERRSPLISAIGAMLDLTDAQIDALFVAAARS